MKRRYKMKKIISALILTVFLGVNFTVAEAAPPKRGGGYPYPLQQQSRQNSRPAIQQSRPSSPRSVVQQSRPSSPRPAIQQSRPSSPRPMVQQPRTSSPRPTMQQPKSSSPRLTMQQSRTSSPRPTMQQSRTSSPRLTMQQSKTVSQPPKMQQSKTVSQPPKVQQSKTVSRPPKVQQSKSVSPHPKMEQSKSASPRPKMEQPRLSSPRLTMQQSSTSSLLLLLQQQKQNIAKSVIHKPKHWEHKETGPRNDLHRPPVQRTYENMHIWRRAHKPPKDHWWDHRPAHRRGHYRGYYNGIYYTDVLSALLTAEIVHSAYDYSPATVINYVDYSANAFIPKEAVKYKGHHYLVFSDIGKSLEDAQQFCESMGGHLATVGDDGKNERLYRLINDSGYDNEYFENYGHDRLIPNEPVTYMKVNPDSNSEEEEYYGLYYWNYKNLREDGTTIGTGGNAFICEWDN